MITRHYCGWRATVSHYFGYFFEPHDNEERSDAERSLSRGEDPLCAVSLNGRTTNSIQEDADHSMMS